MLRAEPILPRPFDVAAFWAPLVASVDQTNKQAEVKFDSTVATFSEENKAKFRLKLEGERPLSPAIIGTCSTEDQIYEWIVKGTRPHVITTRNATTLAFPGTFTPKTMPGVIGSGRGSRGGKTIYAKQVRHPGTTPRNLDKAIAKEMEPEFAKNGKAGLKAAVRVSGHKYR